MATQSNGGTESWRHRVMEAQSWWHRVMAAQSNESTASSAFVLASEHVQSAMQHAWGHKLQRFQFE